MENADIAGWVRHTETRLRVCRVPEPMWVATATGHLLGPAQAWFTTWAADKTDIAWEEFIEAAKQRYSGAFAPIVFGTPMLAIKQTRTVAEYLTQWRTTLSTAPTAITEGNAMLLTLIINGLKPQVCKWVPVGNCTSVKECFKAAVEANNQAAMGFQKTDSSSNNRNPSSHNMQVGRQQLRQENGNKRPREPELQLAQIEDAGKAWGL